MRCRIGPLGAGFESRSPAARTVASTHGAGALPTKLNIDAFSFLGLLVLLSCLNKIA